jgi:hypothetical protein
MCGRTGAGRRDACASELPDVDGPTTLVSLPVLGGLHHTYKRVAAQYRSSQSRQRTLAAYNRGRSAPRVYRDTLEGMGAVFT